VRAMEYIVESQSTDGLGNWTEWAPVAAFRYQKDAKAFALYTMSYQHEEAGIDRVKMRVMHHGKELSFK